MSSNVVCLKWGSKYPAEYVNKLYSMVERHLSLPHRFVCLTDDETNINPKVECLPLLEESLEGWWNKLSIFKETVHDLSGPTVFIDLDVVITDSIDFLFTEKEGDPFISLADFIFPERTFNSSVFRFNIGECTHIFDRFKTELTIEPNGTYRNNEGKVFVGDQDWITHCMYPGGKHQRHTYPTDKIVSYKRSVMNIGHPQPQHSIVVFHGDPNPHEVKESWIKQYWK